MNMIGLVFGRLTVVGKVAGASPIKWECSCSCGGTKVARGDHLRYGKTSSCGCLVKETMRVRQYRHGFFGTATYSTWQSMKNRCNDHTMKDYGGKGVIVCERWERFENFLEDMGERPDGKTLDRRDNSLGYFKENCRWATKKQQGNNTSRNRLLELGDKTLTMAQWGELLGLNQGTIQTRLRRGWSVEDALSTNMKVNQFS